MSWDATAFRQFTANAMDDFGVPLEPLHRIERTSDVRIFLDDIRDPEDRGPLTIRIIVKQPDEEPFESLPAPPVRIIHEGELTKMMDMHNAHIEEEDEPMTFGEAITLLIALGVLLYLIYALLWPERF
jgi:K+-transporting ATPase KdpF subunit